MGSNATALTANNGADGAQDWRASLPEELRGEESLKSFKDLPSLAKSFVETKRMVGNAVHMPKADAPQEEFDKFYARLGRPESPDKYELKRPENPAGGQWDEGLEKEFRTAAHASGLQPRQAQGLLDWFNKTQTERLSAYTKGMEEGVGKLKTEWGTKFDEKVGMAARAVKELGGDELKTMLEETGLGNHPVLVKLFAKIGESMMVDTIIAGDTDMEDSSKEAIQLKIDAIRRDPKSPYNDVKASPAAREIAIKEMDKLYKQLYPEVGAG